MSETTGLDAAYEALQREHGAVQADNAALRERVARLEATVRRLEAAVAAAERRQHRSAAPYSKGPDRRTAAPQRPGRRPGEGPFGFRAAPAPETITDAVVVPVTRTDCPDCGASLGEPTWTSASVTELPERPAPRVTQFAVAVCTCAHCGRTVRGAHPELAPDQYGATAHRVGPRAKAAAHALHYGLGVPQRKVPAVLAELTGVRVTQSALAQDAQQQAAQTVGTAYEQLRTSLPTEPVVHTDDTSWAIGGQSAFLMAFTSSVTTVFQIRWRHRNDEVREVLPADYAGTLVTDRAPMYDATALASVQQQKCLAHIQRSLSQVLVTKVGRGRSFTKQLTALFTAATEFWRPQRAGPVPDWDERVQALNDRLTELLRDRRLPDPDNQRLLNELGRHHDRGNLLRFLQQPEVPPDNNAAERALRPAVIARKGSHCSQNERGAETHARFASVCVTLRQRGLALVDGLLALCTTGSWDTLAPSPAS